MLQQQKSTEQQKSEVQPVQNNVGKEAVPEKPAEEAQQQQQVELKEQEVLKEKPTEEPPQQQLAELRTEEVVEEKPTEAQAELESTKVEQHEETEQSKQDPVKPEEPTLIVVEEENTPLDEPTKNLSEVIASSIAESRSDYSVVRDEPPPMCDVSDAEESDDWVQ